jgi:Domain of unknown function (DUF1707)
MRYDVRTGKVVPDEGHFHVPGWTVPWQQGLSQHRHGYDLRIGDAERDAAMAQLREHFADGRLDLDELTERIDGVLRAKTQRQIDALMADLPRLSNLHPTNRPGEPDGELTDTGRYLVLLLLLFALAAWLLMMAWMYSHTSPYTGPIK